MEINDFRMDAMRIMPRYSILVTPVWVHDRDAPTEFWDGRKLADSSTLGDVAAAQWRMYTTGFTEDWLTVLPAQRNFRVLGNAYYPAGLPIADDATGFTASQGFPNTIGRAVAVQLYEQRIVG